MADKNITQMTKKFDINDHIPEYKEDQLCERCDQPGAADFQTEMLCPQCMQNDVFDVMNLIYD